MALALLARDSTAPGYRFTFELGSNRYWQFVVGTERQRRGDGIEVVADAVHTSPLRGPLPPERFGRGEFEVPGEHFDRERRFIQLWSFRTGNRDGPAVSDIVVIRSVPDPAVESISFARTDVMSTQLHAVETVPNRYREAPLSNALFLDALGSVLQGVLPHLGGLLGGLSGGITAAGGNAGPMAEIGRVVANPDVLRQLMQLLTQVNAARGAAPAPPPAVPALPAAPAPAAAQALAMRGYRRRRRRRRAARYAPLQRCRSVHSEALFEPTMLLTALPALMPLLQQVLNPQTIQAVLNAPNQHLSTVINGVTDFARLGVEDHQRFREHLERLNPGVDDPALDRLMLAMIQSIDRAPAPLRFTRVKGTRLSFDAAPVVMLNGRERTLYQRGGALAFPLSVETTKPIPQAMLQLELKDAETLAVHHRSRYRVEQVASGKLLTVPVVPAAESARLPAGRDYLACVSLAWKSKDGVARGTSVQQQISLAGEYTYDRVDEGSGLIPLADPERFREFWHKVYERGFESDVKRLDVDIRYLYVLAPERHTHARLETQVRLEVADRRARGRLRAGMELSPTALNRLLPQIAPDAPPLSAAELEALLSPAFAERFNQAARYRAQLRGRDGDRGAVWVYPEFKVQHITLQRVAGVDEHGRVRTLEPHEVRFPVPALLHFLGARSS